METLLNAALLSAEPGMERLFNLDFQMIHDAILVAIAVFVLFLVMSYLLFNPARDLLKRRQEKIQSDVDTAEADKTEALLLKAEYESKMKSIDQEAEEILSVARKKALSNEVKIVADAKEEAARIIRQANAEVELERKKAADERNDRDCIADGWKGCSSIYRYYGTEYFGGRNIKRSR